MNIINLETRSHDPYLGVKLQEDLMWTEHISQANQTNRNLGFLRRNFYKCHEYLNMIRIVGPQVSSGLLLASLLVSGNSEDDQLRQVPQQSFRHPSAAGLLRAPSSTILVVVLFAAPYVAAP